MIPDGSPVVITTESYFRAREITFYLTVKYKCNTTIDTTALVIGRLNGIPNTVSIVHVEVMWRVYVVSLCCLLGKISSYRGFRFC